MMALFWCSLCLKQDGWWSEAGDDELPTMQCTYAFEQPFGGKFMEAQTPPLSLVLKRRCDNK